MRCIERKRAYDRAYRKSHRDAANTANRRYRATTAGIIREARWAAGRRLTRLLKGPNGNPV